MSVLDKFIVVSTYGDYFIHFSIFYLQSSLDFRHKSKNVQFI